MKNGILVTNNAYDAIVLANGTYINVTSEVFKDFLDSKNIDLDNWNGESIWGEIENESLEEAARNIGEIIAYYEDRQLIVTDEEGMENRKEFYNQFI